MRKPTIFLIDSDLIDISILVLKIERKFNCNIYTFFDIEEVMIYNDMTPDIFIIDEKTYIKKKEIINQIMTSLNQRNSGAETKFVVYGDKGLVDIHQQMPTSGEEVNIVPLDMGYSSIQLSLNRIIG